MRAEVPRRLLECLAVMARVREGFARDSRLETSLRVCGSDCDAECLARARSRRSREIVDMKALIQY